MTITHTLSLKFCSVLCETQIGTLSTSDIMGRGHGTEALDRKVSPKADHGRLKASRRQHFDVILFVLTGSLQCIRFYYFLFFHKNEGFYH